MWTCSNFRNNLADGARALCESGYAQGDIAILYRWKPRSEEILFQDMMKRLSDLGLRTYWITQNHQSKHNYSVEQPGLRVITALSSLGLEFKVVLLLWAEQFADCCNEDPEKAVIARRQLYVAMTRAQDELYLFGSGYARIFGELEKSQSFEVVANPEFERFSLLPAMRLNCQS